MPKLKRNLKKLGCLPPKSDPRALMYGAFARAPARLPEKTTFWRGRAPFKVRTFGNTEHNDCTFAKQAIAMLRMERLEVRRTPRIPDDEPVRVYREMCKELYGGRDEGAYETDALKWWRRPDKAIHDSQGRALTIDAYVRINHMDQQEVRRALWTTEAHGIAVCLALPIAFGKIDPPRAWDIPEGQSAVGDWLPGSWGGHSMWARDYDKDGIWLVHTWGKQDQLLTWRAASFYLVEAHTVIDSIAYWRAHKPRAAKYLNLASIKKAVNRVSSHKLK